MSKSKQGAYMVIWKDKEDNVHYDYLNKNAFISCLGRGIEYIYDYKEAEEEVKKHFMDIEEVIICKCVDVVEPQLKSIA